MPSRRAATPPPPLLGGATSRRHAQLLLHLTQPGGGGARASVKDLRLRRVFSPASVRLDASPDRVAAKAAKPNAEENLGSVESTPPDAAAAEAIGVRECRPMLAPCSRSKLVRDPSSFGYRRLLPFLTEMAKDDVVDNSQCKIDPIKAGGTEKEKMITVNEELLDALPTESSDFVESLEAMMLPPAFSATCEAQPETILDHQMAEVKDESTVQDSKGFDRSNFGLVKCSVAVEAPSAGISKAANGRVDEFGEGIRSEVEPVGAADSDVKIGDQEMKDCCNDAKEEISLDSGDLSKPKLVRCSRSRLVRHPSSFSYKRLLPFLLEIAQDEISPQKKDAAEVERIAEEKPLTPNGDILPDGQLQPSVKEELLIVHLQESSDFAEVLPCQSSESEHSEVNFGSRTEMIPLLNPQDAQDVQTSMVKSEASLDAPLLEVGLLSRPSDPCTIGKSLSMEEMAGCTPQIESGSRKVAPVGTLWSGGAYSLERRTLSPKKGILKRHTRGCKGICMCLDCTTFRLHADRAFEFSRRQMQEADDIIGHLLNELASLRRLMEKSAIPIVSNENSGALQQNQQELMQGAWERASRVEEVANDRRRQMFLDLNLHCRIPGPRVTFAQYIEEKSISSPENSNTR